MRIDQNSKWKIRQAREKKVSLKIVISIDNWQHGDDYTVK